MGVEGNRELKRSVVGWGGVDVNYSRTNLPKLGTIAVTICSLILPIFF
ncbi:hypothetical protein HanIR_Chr10g0488641 [Helianthus annuus]|nr:hypothetical protein HanIR_Chr10g0488641 [Helianthus annuus]